MSSIQIVSDILNSFITFTVYYSLANEISSGVHSFYNGYDVGVYLLQ